MGLSERLAELRRQAADVVDPNPAVIPGGRQFTLAAVDVGWRIASTERHYANDEFQPEPRGGIVVEVIRRRLDDVETGEVYEQTRYRCLNTSRWTVTSPWELLDAGEVDRAMLAGVDRRGCEVAALWCVRAAIYRPRGSQTDRLKDDELLHDAWRLAHAWAGRR